MLSRGLFNKIQEKYFRYSDGRADDRPVPQRIVVKDFPETLHTLDIKVDHTSDDYYSEEIWLLPNESKFTYFVKMA